MNSCIEIPLWFKGISSIKGIKAQRIWHSNQKLIEIRKFSLMDWLLNKDRKSSNMLSTTQWLPIPHLKQVGALETEILLVWLSANIFIKNLKRRRKNSLSRLKLRTTESVLWGSHRISSIIFGKPASNKYSSSLIWIKMAVYATNKFTARSSNHRFWRFSCLF